MGYSGALGNLIHEKNLKSKISWHCPFKRYLLVYVQFSLDFIVFVQYCTTLFTFIFWKIEEKSKIKWWKYEKAGGWGGNEDRVFWNMNLSAYIKLAMSF
jgi:hypothetical protein